MNSQDGLGPLFSVPITEWSAAQEQLVGWLRYYDAFYDRLESQDYVADREYVHAWMVEYDVIVDAFFVWYRNRSEERKGENRRSGAAQHEANVPRASQHGTVYRAAHQ